MSSMEVGRIGPRERILKKAGDLFYQEGYRAVGIDRVIAEADVAKASFYKHFPSKDDLIIAWITTAEAASLKMLPDINANSTPLFDYVERFIAIARQPWCVGCTYQSAASEFSDINHPIHQAALKVKDNVIAELKRRAKKQGSPKPQKTAEMMFLLLEGVWASVRMFKSDAPLAHAKEAMRALAQA